MIIQMSMSGANSDHSVDSLSLHTFFVSLSQCMLEGSTHTGILCIINMFSPRYYTSCFLLYPFQYTMYASECISDPKLISHASLSKSIVGQHRERGSETMIFQVNDLDKVY